MPAAPCCRNRVRIVASLLAISALLHNSALADENEFFEKKIRPILVEHCYECHSGEAKESGLHVDSLAALISGGERGPAIVPGKPNESPFITAIRHDDTLQMPPSKKLPQPVIEDLMKWVQDGAKWPNAETVPVTPRSPLEERLPSDDDRRFWAFQSPQQTDIPVPAAHQDWARTPIDRFVLKSLEASQLTPNRLADKRTLIRRAAFALTGLPPTPEEVTAFLADESPEAFSTVVERLLASPHYGERWGRHWLDVARYGDSNGLDENLAFGNAWRYRDYVVTSFNADLPYDEFLREQIAGDLLPTSGDEHVQLRRVVATGFLSLGAKMLAEDDPVKMEMDIIDEQLDTLGKAVLGMTFGCARCHDHKFDPISAHDYYALAGIFKSSKTMDNFGVVARWQERPFAVPEVIAERDRQKAAVDSVQAEIAQTMQRETERITAEARGRLAGYLLAAERQMRIEESLKDASPIADNEVRRNAAGYLLLEAEDFARGNVQKDTDNYGAGIGVLVNKGELPNFAEYDIELSEAGSYQIDLRYAAAGARPTQLMFDGKSIKADAAGQVTGSWTSESQKWFVEAIVELSAGRHVIRLENSGPFPHIDKLCVAPAGLSANRPVLAEELLTEPAGVLNSTIVGNWVKYLTAQRDVLDSPFAAWWALRTDGSLDETRMNTSPPAHRLLDEPRPATLTALAQRYQQLANSEDAADLMPLKSLLTAADGPFGLGEKAELAFTEPVVAELKILREKKAVCEAAMPAIPEAMSVSEGKPQNLRIHLRGSHTTLGEEVERRMPRVFANGSDVSISADISGRLQLAEWLTRPDHPLTARVLVNRVWQAHFGDGLVRSPDNFGKLGEAPTHPELLDWMAMEFVRKGWSIKSLHRMILQSAVWQQTTEFNEAAAAVDPENRLLWKMNRRRLEAEAVRDSLLAIGGDLDRTMGGSLLPTGNRQYVTSTSNINVEVYNTPRRTMYLPVVRSAIYDYLTAFDFGDPSAMSGQRDRTTVAPQALFLMNSELVAQESGSLAKTLLALPVSDGDKVSSAFERFYSRPAAEFEIAASLEFIVSYEANLAARGTPQDQCRLMAWKAFCRAMMATNEFLYVN